METSGWVKAGQAMAGIARLLPASVLSAFLVVMAAAFLGSWGSVVAVVWLLAGLAVLTRVGERAAVRAFLRYRPAPQSWLAADIAGLAPGRRIEVYVAPGLSGVFCVGGYTIAAGARSVGAVPAPAPPRCTRLRSRRCATGVSGGPASSWPCCGGPLRGWRACGCSAAFSVRA